MLRVTRKRKRGWVSENWYVRGTIKVWRDGDLVTLTVDQSTGTPDQAQAEGIRDRLAADARKENLTGETRVALFGEWVDRYIEDTGQERFLLKILDFYETTPENEVTPARVLEDGHKAYPGAKPATIKRQWDTPISAIRRNATLPKPRKVEDNARTVFFRPSKAEALLANLTPARLNNDPWIVPLVTFLLGQGPRLGETLAIDAKRDVFLDYGFLIIRNPKNGRELRIELIPRVRAALSTLPNIDTPGPLFRRFDGKPFKERTNRGGQIRTRFARAVSDVGLDPLLYTPHVCRHSWATWSYAQHKDPLKLKTDGGWRSDQYERYVRLNVPGIGDEARAYGWEFAGNAIDAPVRDISNTADKSAS